MVSRFFTIYKGCRIHLPEDSDYDKDCDGRYHVFVVIADLGGKNHIRRPIDGCCANALDEAQRLSIQHAMRLIDSGLKPATKSGK